MMVAPIPHRGQAPPGRWLPGGMAMLQNGPVWKPEPRMSATLVLTEPLPDALAGLDGRLDRDVVVNAEVLENP
jgi:hypothetical protein